MPAKRLAEPAFKKFRSDRITLGPVVISQPILRRYALAAGQVTLWWYAVEGLTYAVQYKNHLEETAWTDVPGDVTASEPVAWKVFPRPPGPQVFLRVLVR